MTEAELLLEFVNRNPRIAKAQKSPGEGLSYLFTLLGESPDVYVQTTIQGHIGMESNRDKLFLYLIQILMKRNMAITLAKNCISINGKSQPINQHPSTSLLILSNSLRL